VNLSELNFEHNEVNSRDLEHQNVDGLEHKTFITPKR